MTVVPSALVQAEVAPVGALGADRADACAELPAVNPMPHPARAALAPPSSRARASTSRKAMRLAGAWTVTADHDSSRYDVQLSVAGLVVAVPPPADAVIPVKEGIEK